jgi:hypothetical protein
VAAAVDRECARLMGTEPGARNAALFRAALKLAKYVDMASTTEITVMLESAALRAGLPAQEARATIHKGLRTGLAHGVLRAA